MDEVSRILAQPLGAFTDPGQRVHWLYLLMALLLVVLSRQRARHWTRLLQSLTSRDARLDLRYVFIDQILYASVLAPLLLGGVEFAAQVTRAWQSLGLTGLGIGGPMVDGLFSLGFVMLTDLCLYGLHRLFHEVPWLWAFHRVHHEAEHLTPLTALRVHPVERLITSSALTLIGGLWLGTVVALAPGASMVESLGVNVFVLAFYLLGYNLRHSPVWLHYPPWLARVFISPAQHQIHHSVAAENQGRNYGFIFALWDRMFGSLINPSQELELSFGASTNEQPARGVLELYLRPFRECLQHLLADPEPLPE